MYDGREIAIQVLPEPQVATDDYFLIMLKEWNPQTWEVSDPKEFFVPKSSNLAQLGKVICENFNHIKPENLMCTKINSAWNFHRV